MSMHVGMVSRRNRTGKGGSGWPAISWKRGRQLCGLLVLVLVAMSGCGGPGKPSFEPGSIEEGQASYYGHQFQGRATASGEIYDENKLTAAHKTLAFGTMVRVTNLNNGKKVVVRVNDRGPFVKGRIIDLSYKAAGDIGMIAAGVVPVRVEVLESADGL